MCIRDSPYGPWLYDFSVGLLFRCFVFFRIEHRFHENYSIFLRCRKHLLNLPVKYQLQSIDTIRGAPDTSDERKFTSKQQISSGSIETCEDVQVPEAEGQSKDVLKQHADKHLLVKEEKKVEGSIPFVILVNPTKLDNEHSFEEPALLEGILFSVGSAVMSCLLYTSPSPRDATLSRMPSSA